MDRRNTLKLYYSNNDYYIAFSVLFFILTIVTLVISIVIPFLLKDGKCSCDLVCTKNSLEDDNLAFIYNESAPRFGRYYLDIDTLTLSHEKPVNPILYRDGFLYASDKVRVLTLRRDEDFFLRERFKLSLEKQLPDNIPNIFQKWTLNDSSIYTKNFEYKLTIDIALRLIVVSYKKLDKTSCHWYFEKT